MVNFMVDHVKKSLTRIKLSTGSTAHAFLNKLNLIHFQILKIGGKMFVKKTYLLNYLI